MSVTQQIPVEIQAYVAELQSQILYVSDRAASNAGKIAQQELFILQLNEDKKKLQEERNSLENELQQLKAAIQE